MAQLRVGAISAEEAGERVFAALAALMKSELFGMAAVADLAEPIGDFVQRFMDRWASQPDKLQSLHHILTSAPSLDDPINAPDNPTTPHRSVQLIYEQLSPLLSTEPDLARELLQFVSTSCYSSGHIHVFVPEEGAAAGSISVGSVPRGEPTGDQSEEAAREHREAKADEVLRGGATSQALA